MTSLRNAKTASGFWSHASHKSTNESIGHQHIITGPLFKTPKELCTCGAVVPPQYMHEERDSAKIQEKEVTCSKMVASDRRSKRALNIEAVEVGCAPPPGSTSATVVEPSKESMDTRRSTFSGSPSSSAPLPSKLASIAVGDQEISSTSGGGGSPLLEEDTDSNSTSHPSSSLQAEEEEQIMEQEGTLDDDNSHVSVQPPPTNSCPDDEVAVEDDDPIQQHQQQHDKRTKIARITPGDDNSLENEKAVSVRTISSDIESEFEARGEELDHTLNDLRLLLQKDDSEQEPSSTSCDAEGDFSASSFSVGMLVQSPSAWNLTTPLVELEDETDSSSPSNIPATAAAQVQQPETELNRAVRERTGSRISGHSEDGMSQISSLYGLGRPVYHDFLNAPEDKFWNRPISLKHPRTIFRRIRLYAGKVVTYPSIQLGVVWLIVINAVLMGVATFDFVTDDPSVERAFEATDRVFLSIFTAELILQLLYLGLSLFGDGWLLFDLIVIVASWSLESLQG